jgi:hypothetical protein
MPPVEPTPVLPRESFLAAPELAQEASYFAASARISSLRVSSISSSEQYCGSARCHLFPKGDLGREKSPCLTACLCLHGEISA